MDKQEKLTHLLFWAKSGKRLPRFLIFPLSSALLHRLENFAELSISPCFETFAEPLIIFFYFAAINFAVLKIRQGGLISLS